MKKSARDLVSNLAFWSAPVEPEPLGGGITNTNFIVQDRGERYVVRVGEDIPIHGVMRFNEIAAAQAAHAVGISPEIVHNVDGVFVMRFIEGQTLTEQDVKKEKNLKRIIHLIKTCHIELPKHFYGPALVFWPFHVIRNYIHTARRDNSRMKVLLPRFLDISEKLETAVGEIKLVFGHNDLLAANFIDSGERLWLLDWDYAGYNTALFDLANLSSNNDLTEDQEEWLLIDYYQKEVTDTLRYRFATMKCVSLLRETLWSIVSEIHSSLDFDYINYTKRYLDRFEDSYKVLGQMG